VEDLERAAGHWGHYAALALAQLPDGAGVPSLLRMADPAGDGGVSPARLQALQVLAQLAPMNPEVRSALVEQARANSILPHMWPFLAQPLAGETARLQNPVLDSRPAAPEEARKGMVHVPRGNQSLYWAREGGALSPLQVTRQLALIDELRAATSDPDARRVLEQVRLMVEPGS